MYDLSLTGQDAFDVEVWSTPPDQVELFEPGADRGTIRLGHFEVGRRQSFFVMGRGGFGGGSTRVHISWKSSKRCRKREQRDLL